MFKQGEICNIMWDGPKGRNWKQKTFQVRKKSGALNQYGGSGNGKETLDKRT